MNIYEKCPDLHSERFLLRLISKDDTDDLLKVYSDKAAVPFFNGDNCHGDDFYYATKERMQQAVDFWLDAFKNGWFIRWTIVDNSTNEAIGTIEAFHRDSDDSYDGYGLFRLDLRSDYETQENIEDILKVLVPAMYEYFNCDKCMTKAFPKAAQRRIALKMVGFTESDKPMIGGDDRVEYSDYWVAENEN